MSAPTPGTSNTRMYCGNHGAGRTRWLGDFDTPETTHQSLRRNPAQGIREKCAIAPN
jgi:hypothetical protein